MNDEPQLFAPQRFLGDRQASYGLMFRVVAAISNTGTINRGTTFIRYDRHLIDSCSAFRVDGGMYIHLTVCLCSLSNISYLVLPCRMTGSLLNQTLIGTFPYPIVTRNGNIVDRFLTYSVRMMVHNYIL